MLNTRSLPWILAGAAVAATVTFGAARLRQDPPSMAELLEQARPGPENARLMALEGSWEVSFQAPGAASRTGEGSAQSILEGRFLVVDFEVEDVGETRYTLGFDRRHREYSLVAMDTAGTYFVTARGPASEGVARMAGTDDDPYMESLGFEKKFEFELALESSDAFTVTTYFIDTRTAEETRMRAAEFRFRREER